MPPPPPPPVFSLGCRQFQPLGVRALGGKRLHAMIFTSSSCEFVLRRARDTTQHTHSHSIRLKSPPYPPPPPPPLPTQSSGFSVVAKKAGSSQTSQKKAHIITYTVQASIGRRPGRSGYFSKNTCFNMRREKKRDRVRARPLEIERM